MKRTPPTLRETQTFFLVTTIVVTFFLIAMTYRTRSNAEGRWALEDEMGVQERSTTALLQRLKWLHARQQVEIDTLYTQVEMLRATLKAIHPQPNFMPATKQAWPDRPPAYAHPRPRTLGPHQKK